MPTRIRFAGDENLGITVSEGMEEVRAAFSVEPGRPARLTRVPDGASVYVNPANVAYWYEHPEAR